MTSAASTQKPKPFSKSVLTTLLPAICLLAGSLSTGHLRADVMISSLRDFDFGLYPGNGGLRGSDNLCVNALPRSRYSVTFIGSGAAGRFEVSNGVDVIPYRVRFNDQPRGRGRRVRANQPLNNQTGASDQLNCPGGLNAKVEIRFRRRDLQAAQPGRYRGTLTVIIAPQ